MRILANPSLFWYNWFRNGTDKPYLVYCSFLQNYILYIRVYKPYLISTVVDKPAAPEGPGGDRQRDPDQAAYLEDHYGLPGGSGHGL